MGVHFVQLGDETLIDLRNDSVTPETLAEGVTAHDKSGNRIIGTMSLLNNHDITLGVHTDGLLYIFIDGVPTGNGVSMPDKVGDVYGNVDSGNHIDLRGNLADGTYTFSYIMEDGSKVPVGSLVKDTNVYYSVTKNLSYCSIDNSATSVIEGEPYSATISANEGYELKTVTVTMGGSPVSVTNGVINIASVTGNIVITAVAEEVVSNPTNQIPISIKADGNPYVGTNGEKGYKLNTRLRSSGEEAALNGASVTGFIPAKKGDTLYMTGMYVSEASGNTRLCTYNSSKGTISVDHYPASYTNEGNGVYSFVIPDDGTEFIRLSVVKLMDGTETVYIKRNGKWI